MNIYDEEERVRQTLVMWSWIVIIATICIIGLTYKYISEKTETRTTMEAK